MVDEIFMILLLLLLSSFFVETNVTQRTFQCKCQAYFYMKCPFWKIFLNFSQSIPNTTGSFVKNIFGFWWCEHLETCVRVNKSPTMPRIFTDKYGILLAYTLHPVKSFGKVNSCSFCSEIVLEVMDQ